MIPGRHGYHRQQPNDFVCPQLEQMDCVGGGGGGGGGLRHLILGNINVAIIKGHKSTSSMCIALHNEIL